MLAYNPGVPATGETSPLWALFLALLHTLVASGPSVVALTKFAGFGLHLAAATVLGFALKPVQTARSWLVWAAAGLVATHPNLLAASVSGMEVPLATLVSALIVMAAVRGRPLPLFLLGALSFVARPETAVIASSFPFLFGARDDVRKAAALAAAAGCGSLAAFGLVAWRNYTVSGLWMPATFYVKAGRGSLLDTDPQVRGFVDLFGHIAVVESALAVLAVAIVAGCFLCVRRATAAERAGAAMAWTGLAFCAVSFALIPPADPSAFYHQRYVLPALPVLIGALPLLLDGLSSRLSPRSAPFVNGAAVVVLAALLFASTPERARRMANDARNIDDVQVAFGRALAGARETQVLWAIDAGASRYFGRPYVVDLMALNTPELLRPEGVVFMRAHRPHYLDVLPGWSQVVVDTNQGLPTATFETTTPYTVTSSPGMRMHFLITCRPAGLTGRMYVHDRRFGFVCPP
jgi:hypothetical protein